MTASEKPSHMLTFHLQGLELTESDQNEYISA